MDLLSICEDLASNIIEFDALGSSENQIHESDIQHWQLLFKLTRAEAIEEISSWRADFSRQSLSRDAWEAIKNSQSAKNFSKESYEYYMARGRKLEHRSAPAASDTSMYLLRIHETSPNIRMVQDLLGTNEIQVLPGLDDDGSPVQFCYLDANMRRLLLERLDSSTSVQFKPSFIRVSIAEKKLDMNSKYPTLGIEATLPHHRLNSNTDCIEPTQDEYPVRYFFYGTLADRAVLSRVLGLSDDGAIQYEPAEVHGAILTSWAGKYKGLIDGDVGARVSGVMYWVTSQEEEQALRIYETGRNIARMPPSTPTKRRNRADTQPTTPTSPTSERSRRPTTRQWMRGLEKFRTREVVESSLPFKFGVEFELQLRPKPDGKAKIYPPEACAPVRVQRRYNLDLLQEIAQILKKSDIEAVAPDISEEESLDYTKWNVVLDASLSKLHVGDGFYPVEIIMPVITANKDWAKTIDQFWELLLASFEARLDASCGTHVHISWSYEHHTLQHLRDIAKSVGF